MYKTYEALIIGSGAAGLSAALSLYTQGVKNIAIITEGLYMGTSINTGSDKQTYYKLSSSGAERDSVYDMAKTLYGCGCMEGFHALTEAALSSRCFFRLCEYGVDFPKNEYGEYVGYRTDHDVRRRASSCGPLTSKFMCERMIEKIKEKKISVFENKRAVKLILKNGKLCGVFTYDFAEGKIIAYKSHNIILALGGASKIYKSSVYPKAQTGGLALAASLGVPLCNITEWQYGIASVKFRWNLSGSFMQVIPRFISTDENGNLYEFLPEYIKNSCDMIFQKGYNWPFSPKNLCENKSSMIDIAVYCEKHLKHRRVFMDFRSNANEYCFESLSTEAREYLSNSDCILDTPIKRLMKLNKKAYELFLSNGIDLNKEPLEIDVCAQHCNGGIKVDKNYMTEINGLYAAGECAAVFGITRPGGTALNSTQVSSMRAAMSIKENGDFSAINESFAVPFEISEEKSDYISKRDELQQLMSDNAAFIRSTNSLKKTFTRLCKMYDETINTAFCSDKALTVFEDRDLILTALCAVYAMIAYAENGGKSRGGYLINNSEHELLDYIKSNVSRTDFLNVDKKTVYDIRYSDKSKSTDYDSFSFTKRKVSKIPKSEQWFEKVISEK